MLLWKFSQWASLLLKVLYRWGIYLTVCTHNWSNQFNYISCNASNRIFETILPLVKNISKVHNQQNSIPTDLRRVFCQSLLYSGKQSNESRWLSLKTIWCETCKSLAMIGYSREVYLISYVISDLETPTRITAVIPKPTWVKNLVSSLSWKSNLEEIFVKPCHLWSLHFLKWRLNDMASVTVQCLSYCRVSQYVYVIVVWTKIKLCQFCCSTCSFS